MRGSIQVELIRDTDVPPYNLPLRLAGFWCRWSIVSVRGVTESVLLGCLATRFLGTTLEWDAANLTFTNHTEANRFIRRQYRRDWEVEGL